MSEIIWQKRIRNWAGFLGMILPWLCLFGAYMVNRFTPLGKSFWSDLSISATYYITPVLTGVLTTASMVLMCYDGYDLQDNIITTLSGVFGICIVIFPCNCSIATAHTGLFQLPVKVSHVIHCISALTFFCLLAYNDMFLFTKHGENMSDKKKQRNIVYKVCGIGMVIAMIIMLIPVSFPAKIWWVEMIALTFFGFSWLTKGDAFPFLNDKPNSAPDISDVIAGAD